ncbi:hypothetical protein JG559_06810 [Enterococcus faecalis]|uniref:Uncharacterized protein n=1 Tax=Enterococcus faecalis TaxID=1351 RepID=A0A974S6G4_ENTFL|nr:hypothetical protein JG559_06810 [Enterococcus faecalis]
MLKEKDQSGPVEKRRLFMIELQRSSSFKKRLAGSLRQYSKTNPQWVEELMKRISVESFSTTRRQ